MNNIKFKWYYKESKESMNRSPILNTEGKQIETTTPYFIIPKGLIGKYVFCTLVIEGEKGYNDVSEDFESVGEIKAVEVTPQVISGQTILPLFDGETVKVGTRLTAKNKEIFELIENPESSKEPKDSRGEAILPPSIKSIDYAWERGYVQDEIFAKEGETLSTDAYYDVQPSDVGYYIQLTYTLHLDDNVNYVLTTDVFSVINGNGENGIEKGDISVSTPPSIKLNGNTIDEDTQISYGDTLTVEPPVTTPSSEGATVTYQWVKVDEDGNVTPLTDPSTDNTEYVVGNEYEVDGVPTSAESGDRIQCIVAINGVEGYEDTEAPTITTKPTEAVSVKVNDFVVESENGIKVGETITIKPSDDKIVVYTPSNGAETTYDVTYEWGVVEQVDGETVYRPIANANTENFDITSDLANKTLYCKVSVDNIGDAKNFNVTSSETITEFGVSSGVLTGKVTILGNNLIGEELTAKVEDLVEGSWVKATWYSSEHGATIDDKENFTYLTESQYVEAVGTTSDALKYTIGSNLSGKNIWVIVDVKCSGYEHEGSQILSIWDNTDTANNESEDVVKVSVSPILVVSEKPNYDKYIINDVFGVTPSLKYGTESPSAVTAIKTVEYTWFSSSIDSSEQSFEDAFNDANKYVSANNTNTIVVDNGEMINKFLYCRISNIELENDSDFELEPTVAYVKVGYINMAKFTIEDLVINGNVCYGQKLEATCKIYDERGNLIQI